MKVYKMVSREDGVSTCVSAPWMASPYALRNRQELSEAEGTGHTWSSLMSG